MKGPISLFGKGITPEGVMQGLLENSWFSTAVASIARRPKLIDRLFITKKYTRKGIYRFKLYKGGELKEVIIDDYIPCYFEGTPIFTRGKENELWVLLLEKAYAKLFGSYKSLINGECAKALVDFTGMPIEKMSLPNSADVFEETDLHKNPEVVIKSDLEIYEEIENALDEGCIMCARTQHDEYQMNFEFDKDLSDDEDEENLYYNYAILDAQERKVGEKMIKIKSTMPVLAWTGSTTKNTRLWRDKQIIVEKHRGSTIKARLLMDPYEYDFNEYERGSEPDSMPSSRSLSLRGTKRRNWVEENNLTNWNYDNSFWISLDNFVERFSSVEICKTKVVESARIKGKFIKSIDRLVKEQDHTVSMFYYSFETTQPITELTVGLHQEDDECLGCNLRKLIDVGFIILEESGGYFWIHDFSSIEKKRDKFFKTTLTKGQYHIVPITTGALLKRPYGKEEKFYLDVPNKEYQYGNLHPFFESTISDIFRKYDICCNDRLDAVELNSLGKVINNEFFKVVLRTDFSLTDFIPNESIDEKGMTEYGFK